MYSGSSGGCTLAPMPMIRVRRGLVTSAAVYGSTVLGLAGTIVAARLLGAEDFGRFALVIATVTFVQLVLDATGEEALVKYGHRYLATGEPGRLRRLIGVVGRLKGATAALSSLVLVGLAAASGALFGDAGLTESLLVAALIPPLQSTEGTAGALLLVWGRHDARAAFLLLSAALRLTAIAAAGSGGVTITVAAVVVAQAAGTAAIAAAGWRSMHAVRAATSVPIGVERRPVLTFIGQSAAGSALASVRLWLPLVVLGLAANPLQVGYLRVAQGSQQGFSALSAPVRLIMLTEHTRDWEHGRADLVIASLRRYTIGATLAASVTAPPLILFMPWLIELAFSTEFTDATDAARLMVVAAALQLITAWSKSVPISIGRPGLRTALYGAETLVLVPLVAFMGAAWGASGAAGAVLATSALASAAWGLVLIRLSRRAVAESAEATPRPIP